MKLLVLTPMLAHALSSRSWSRVVLEREGRKDAVRSEPSIVFGVPAGYAGGWYGCIHVSHCGCVHVGHGQQKVRCKYRGTATPRLDDFKKNLRKLKKRGAKARTQIFPRSRSLNSARCRVAPFSYQRYPSPKK